MTKTPLGSCLIVAEMAGFRLLPPVLIASLISLLLTSRVSMIETQRAREVRTNVANAVVDLRASGGIGGALVRTVPWPGTRVIGISRRPPAGAEHLRPTLPTRPSGASWASSFARELAGFDGERAVFIHAAGTLEPIGFAGEVDGAAYARNVVLNSAAGQVLDTCSWQRPGRFGRPATW